MVIDSGANWLKLDLPITEVQCKSAVANRRIVEPSQISQRFFEGWNQYWQRDSGDDLPNGFMDWFQRLPQWEHQDYAHKCGRFS